MVYKEPETPRVTFTDALLDEVLEADEVESRHSGSTGDYLLIFDGEVPIDDTWSILEAVVGDEVRPVNVVDSLTNDDEDGNVRTELVITA